MAKDITDPDELVRVKDPATSHEFTTTLALAKGRGYTVLNKPALGRDGRPLPPKPHIPTVSAKSADTAADQAATTTK